MSADDLDVAVLGPVEVRTVSGTLLGVPRGRPLALLALLVVHRGSVVPADAAIEAVWGQDPPTHPRNALQLAVSRVRQGLRAAGGDAVEVLVARGGGYELRLAPGTVDAERFETLTAAGRAQLARGDLAGAAGSLRRALDLWRGPAFLDVRDEPFAHAEAGRLEELRMSALGDRIDADLALGRHAALTAELPGLVAAHPLREPLRAQLMLALYGSGRQAEALAAYREGRRTLVDELGIEPSLGLREAEAIVLRGEPLAGPEAATAAERPTGASPRRRQVTCLVVEPVDVDGLAARLDPEALQRFLTALQNRVGEVCGRLGGTVRGSDDGSVSVVFGWPAAHEDDARRAVRAAAELRGEAVSGSALRVGVATAEVVTADDGARPPVLGDAAAGAHRLARSAGPGQALLAATTWALVRDIADGTVTPVQGAEGVAGAAAGIGTGVLLGSVQEGAPLVRDAAGPVVGRAAEVDLVRTALDRVVSRRSAELVTVLGEPGMGKTRLSFEVARLLGGSATVLRGACRTYGQSATYWPLPEIVAQGAAAAGDDVTAWAVRLGLEPGVAERLAVTLGLADGAAGEETPWAFRRLVAGLAATRPLVLVVDDLHAAGPELLDLVERVATLDDSPVLVLCLARPELMDLRPDWASGRVHLLRPLDDADSRALVGRLGSVLDPTAVDAVVHRAAGNPLFLEQLYRHLAERSGDGGTAGSGDLPPALQALLAARLDLIPADERAVLERGAVEGETFHSESVLSMAVDGDTDTGTDLAAGRRRAERLLDGLIRRDLVVPVAEGRPGGGPAFAFRHRLLREAAYGALPRAGRATLHERHAGWLARLDPPGPDSDAQIGFHLELAHDHLVAVGDLGAATDEVARRAGAHLARAARQAHRRSDLAAEIGLLERALRLLGPDRADGAELLPALAAALAEAGTFTRAAEIAALGVRAGSALDLPSVRWSSTVELERTRLYSRPDLVDVEGSLRVCAAAAEGLAALDDDLGLARVEYLTAELVWMTGKPDTVMTHLRRQVERARHAGAGFEVAAGLTYLAWSLVEGATPVQQGLDEVAEMAASAAGDYVAETGLLGFRAALEAMAGRAVESREHMARSRAGIDELGLRLPAAAMADFDARSRMLVEDWAGAEAAVRQALDISRGSGDRWFQSTLLVDLAHAVLGDGRLADGEEAVARIDDVPAPSDTEWVVRRETALARLEALRGEPDRAVARAAEAVALADPTQMLTMRIHAHRVLAELLARCGRVSEASVAAREAARLAGLKGDVVTLAAVGRLA